MSRRDPEEAFELITEEMGLRGIAVALYRVITSEDPVLVVKNRKREESLESLVKSVTEKVSTTLFGPNEQREGSGFMITTEDEYKENWKKFAGKEICMVEEETTVKNPGVDLMEEALENALGTLAVSPIDRIRRVIGSVVTTTSQIRARFEIAEEKGEKVDKSEIRQILKTTLPNKASREFVKNVLKMWGKELD